MTDIELKPGWWKQPSPFTPTGAWQAEDEPYPGDYSARPAKPELPIVINCSTTGCSKSVTVGSADSKTTYTCREHTEKAPDSVRFQEFQHDKKLNEVSGDKRHGE